MHLVRTKSFSFSEDSRPSNGQSKRSFISEYTFDKRHDGLLSKEISSWDVRLIYRSSLSLSCRSWQFGRYDLKKTFVDNKFSGSDSNTLASSITYLHHSYSITIALWKERETRKTETKWRRRCFMRFGLVWLCSMKYQPLWFISCQILFIHILYMISKQIVWW